MTTIDGERLDAVLRAIAKHRWVGYKPELSVEQVHELCTVLAPHLSQAAEVRQRDMDHVRDDLLALIPSDRQAGLSTAGLGTVLSVAFDHVAVLVWLLAEARHQRDEARAALSSRDTTTPTEWSKLSDEPPAAITVLIDEADEEGAPFLVRHPGGGWSWSPSQSVEDADNPEMWGKAIRWTNGATLRVVASSAAAPVGQDTPEARS